MSSATEPRASDALLSQLAAPARDCLGPILERAMNTTRREFLDQLAVGAAAFGGLPLALGAAAQSLDAEPAPRRAPDWDLSWVSRLAGKHKAVFDVPEVESGYGVWRASVWA